VLLVFASLGCGMASGPFLRPGREALVEGAPVLAVLAAVLPTAIVGALSFFAKTTLSDIRERIGAVAGDVRALVVKMEDHAKDIGALRVMDSGLAERLASTERLVDKLEGRLNQHEESCRLTKSRGR
jgi:hypothetical protein